MYYEFSEAVNKIAGYRVLAIDRGEREDFLKVSVDVDIENALNIIYSEILKDDSKCTQAVIDAAQDAFDRLIHPSIEREIRNILTENASDAAIKVFSSNLRQLLMQPPVKGLSLIHI